VLEQAFKLERALEPDDLDLDRAVAGSRHQPIRGRL
jgi:hypothetical protein